MGRSVSYPAGAIVAFNDVETLYFCSSCALGGQEEGTCELCDGPLEIDEEHPDWDEEVYQYHERIKEIFPSFEPCDKWLDREDHAIAENSFAYFGISEYCGLVAIWLVRKELNVFDPLNYGLADRWLAQVEKKFLATFGTLRKLGSMSNGEGVYERIERA
jgi:hypothetical protein